MTRAESLLETVQLLGPAHRGVDPVAEAYDDLTEMFGEIHSEYAEPIQLLGIADAEDHKLATEYFQLVAEVQRRTAAFWDLVADSE